MIWVLSVLNVIASLSTSDKLSLANCILTGFFLIATIISVICAFKAYKHQKERARKAAACDLARYYSENIIQRYAFVSNIMQRTGLEAKTKELFPYNQLQQFSRTELQAFLSREHLQYEDAKNIFLEPDPEAILSVKVSFANSIQAREAIVREHIITDPATGDKHIAFTDALQNEFFDSASNFLNDLEWFSMSCRYGISDEEILYQSLHKTFLSTVWLMYFYICNQNSSNEDKLFTNIIWLFCKWRKRLVDIQRRAEKKQAKAQRKVEAAEHRRLAAEQELSNANPEVHSGRPLKK